MKRILIISIMMLMGLGFSMQAHADLNLIGQGTSAHGTWNLIYDTDRDITWYDFTKFYDSWQNQMNWADALSVTFGVNTYDDWRLPATVDGLYVWGYDGTTTAGYNITSSEMGHLFYVELGNKGYCDTFGNCPQSGWGLTNTGDFQNLQPDFYWSGTEYSASPSNAWYFFPYLGFQDSDLSKVGSYAYAIAVRPGLAVVPEPISSILFVTGGTLLAGRRLIRKKRT